MSNLSYCRFRNTLSDLKQCKDSIDGGIESKEEFEAMKCMIQICEDFIEQANWYQDKSFAQYANENGLDEDYLSL